MSSSKPLLAYRQLVRAARLAFRGDEVSANASRIRIREEFVKPAIDRADLLKRTQMARDVAHILRSNVVQGKLNEKGNYKLNIHSETELGDNDSRLQPTAASPAGTTSTGCCGGKSS